MGIKELGGGYHLRVCVDESGNGLAKKGAEDGEQVWMMGVVLALLMKILTKIGQGDEGDDPKNGKTCLIVRYKRYKPYMPIN